jgi:MoaA/NifB/PqqE/SkfB family radical SAM enzyme
MQADKIRVQTDIIPRNSAAPVCGPQLKTRTEIMARRIPFLSKLSIIFTDKCNITCRHCMPDCTPQKNRTLEWDELRTIIESASKIASLKALCFTGGEPFLFPSLLADCIALASGFGLETTVMSNAFWAKSVEQAKKTLLRLPGLRSIGISTDSFHQEFIDIDRIRNAIIAANDLSIECAVRVCHLDSPDEEIEAVRQQLAEFNGLYELEHQPVQPLGRAEDEINYDRIFSYDTKMACCRSADVQAINPSGFVTACCGGSGDWSCGHPLDFGNPLVDGMPEVVHRIESSMVLHAVRLWGPAGLLHLAQQQALLEESACPDPGIQNICELCRFMVTDPERAGLLQRAVEKHDVQQEIAWARLTELGEIGAISLLSGS